MYNAEKNHASRAPLQPAAAGAGRLLGRCLRYVSAVLYVFLVCDLRELLVVVDLVFLILHFMDLIIYSATIFPDISDGGTPGPGTVN